MKKIIILVLCLYSINYAHAQYRKIDLKTAREIAWMSDNTDSIKGVIIQMHGLSVLTLKSEPNTEEQSWIDNGYLVIYPHYGPWCWMNRAAVGMVDAIVDAVFETYKLPATTPILTEGGSMGGFCALIYTRYAKRKVAASLANCPVCDIKYHFTERPDLPRTFRCAYWSENKDFDKAMTEHNLMDQVSKMPDIPYFIMHTTGDQAVNKKRHSDLFVQKMRETGHNKVIYNEIEGGKHCGPIPDDVYKAKQEFILQFVK